MRSLVAPMVVLVPAFVTLVVAAMTWRKLQRGDERARSEIIRWEIGASVFEFGPSTGPRLLYVLLRGAVAGLLAFTICVLLVGGYLLATGEIRL